jgi:hypothetical protein
VLLAPALHLKETAMSLEVVLILLFVVVLLKPKEVVWQL